MKNNLILNTILILLVAAAGFYVGMQYQKSKPVNMQFGNRQFRQNNNGQRQFSGRGGMAPVSGEIIKQDDNSITVKLADGSSKIIVLSTDTKINKTSQGSKSDLKTGETITAFGTANSDGSITAQNVSLGNFMFRGGQRTNQATPTTQ